MTFVHVIFCEAQLRERYVVWSIKRFTSYEDNSDGLHTQ